MSVVESPNGSILRDNDECDNSEYNVSLKNETLVSDNLDFDDLDLPSVDQLPTLEDVLNELDTGSISFETIPELDGVSENDSGRRLFANFDDCSDVSSVVSSTKKHSLPRSSTWHAEQRYKQKSSKKSDGSADILRCVALRGITNQMNSAKERVDAGIPTAMAVCDKYVAVGASHGLVLVFGTQQVLQCCIGSVANAMETGGVAALDFSPNCDKLLVGFANGWVQVFDSATGKLHQRIVDAHPPGYSVLHLKFCKLDASTAALNDSGGSVFEISFSKVRKKASSRCIFSGSRGEVCCIEPLIIKGAYQKHCAYFADACLLAMASLTKVIVVRLVPSTRVIFAASLAGRADSAPLLCWQFVPVHLSENSRIVDPLLTFARDKTIFMYQLHTSDGEKFNSFLVRKIQTENSMVHLQWLGARSLLAVDWRERFNLYDPYSGECLESADGSHTRLAYGSSAFKALATGGNVSKALNYMAGKVCYHSLASLDKRVLLLGVEGVYAISTRTWLERVDGLVQNGDCYAAVDLLMQFYSGKRKIGAGNLSSEGNWRTILADKALHVLLGYVETSLDRLVELRSKEDQLDQLLSDIIPLCMKACVMFKREDFLYEMIYPKFAEDPVSKDSFLEYLDDFISNGVLTNLPPVIVQDYFSHLEREGLYGAIETSVVRLPIECLDLHQIMTICRVHNLYDGIIYVFNRALNDFLSPLQEMMAALAKTVDNCDLLTDEDILLGNKILLYISCCFSGQMYPLGNLDLEAAKGVANQVFCFLITERSSENGYTQNAKYLHMRTLLRFDCREFLNVLAMAFGGHYLYIDEQQKLLDVLLEIMIDDSSWANFQIGAFFTFVIRQIVLRSGDVQLSRSLFQKLLKLVLQGKLESIGSSSFEERQQALIEFLLWPKSGQLVNEDEILSLAQKAQYFYVCELLYGKRRQFDKIVECYSYDTFRREAIFDYVEKILSSGDVTTEEKQSVKVTFVKLLNRVLAVDPKRCAGIITRFCMDMFYELCLALESTNNIDVAFLKYVLEIRISLGKNNFLDDDKKNFEIGRLLCRRFCELHDSVSLLDIFRSNEAFCAEEMLQLCKEHDITPAVVYLLERSGRLDEAISWIEQDLLKIVTFDPINIGRLDTSVISAVEFLREKCDGVPKEQQERYWFRLLLVVMRETSADPAVDGGLKNCIVRIIHAMIHFVNPSEILPKLLEHPLFQNGTYSEFHDLIGGILRSYDHEEMLISKLNSCIYGETFESFRRLHGLSSNGCRIGATVCAVCSEVLFINNDSTSLVFDCSHCYHVECLKNQNSFVVNREGVREWKCCFCIRQKSAKVASSKTPGRIQRADKFYHSVELADQQGFVSKFELLRTVETGRGTLATTARPNEFDMFASLNLAPPKT